MREKRDRKTTTKKLLKFQTRKKQQKITESIVLTILRGLPADGFERLCKLLLRESGFEQVDVTGRSGDGGIDGIVILQINPFVSFNLLFQYKR